MIYFAQAEHVGHIKIGFHAGTDAHDRLRELQTGCPSKLILLGTIPGGPETEADLHRQFAFAHVHGEWFKPVPELLTFIGQGVVDPRQGPASVETRFVQIKVLTVNGKSFTQALFRQLPSREIAYYCTEEKEVRFWEEDEFMIWGCISFQGADYFLYEMSGNLFRQQLSPGPESDYCSLGEWITARDAWRPFRVKMLRTHQQLFIGV